MNLEEYAKAKGFDAATLERYGVRQFNGHVEIPYRLADGSEFRAQHVLAAAGKSRFAWGEGEGTVPYGLDRPVPWKNGVVWLVEGASDCWALWDRNVPALGLPGGTNLACVNAKDFADAKDVFAICEPDKTGAGFARRVALKLYDTGFAGHVYEVSLGRFKDAREAYNDLDEGAFRALLTTTWRERKRVARPQVSAITEDSVPFADLYDKVPEVIPWLVDGLLPVGGTMLLSAKPKAGKSTFARALAASVMRGEPFLGRACAKGSVLWIALEERQDDVLRAFQALGLPRDAGLRFGWKKPADHLGWLRQQVDAHHPALVVIDTWSRWTDVDNINDYSEVTRVTTPLLEIARAGATQVWVHHNNKGISRNGDAVLGSSALFASADPLVTVARAEDGMRTCWSIQRVGVDMDEIVLKLDHAGGVTNGGSRHKALVKQAAAKIPEILPLFGMTSEDLVDAVGQRRKIVLEALRQCVMEGRVRQTKDGRTTLYCLEGGAPVSGNAESIDEKKKYPGSQRLLGTSEPHDYSSTERNFEEPPGTAELPEPGNAGNPGTSSVNPQPLDGHFHTGSAANPCELCGATLGAHYGDV